MNHLDSLCNSENIQIYLQVEKVQLPSERQLSIGFSLVIRNQQNEIYDWEDGTKESEDEYYYWEEIDQAGLPERNLFLWERMEQLFLKV